MKSIVETLLAPVDEASGTARSLTAVELGARPYRPGRAVIATS